MNIGCYSWINLSNPEYLYGQEQDTITIYSQLSRVEFPEGFEFHSEYAEFNLLSWGKNTAWTTSPYNYPITNVVLNLQTPVVFEDGVWKSSINVTITHILEMNMDTWVWNGLIMTKKIL